jgi:hypothetical protein
VIDPCLALNSLAQLQLESVWCVSTVLSHASLCSLSSFPSRDDRASCVARCSSSQATRFISDEYSLVEWEALVWAFSPGSTLETGLKGFHRRGLKCPRTPLPFSPGWWYQPRPKGGFELLFHDKKLAPNFSPRWCFHSRLKGSPFVSGRNTTRDKKGSPFVSGGNTTRDCKCNQA